jgi:hypothetical protein
MASVCTRHASVGLVPAGQQLSSYAPPMVAICSDGFRPAGCPKETFWRDELSRISGVPIGCENTQAIGVRSNGSSLAACSCSVVAPPGQARRKHDVCRRKPLKWSPRIPVAAQLLPRQDKPDGTTVKSP